MSVRVNLLPREIVERARARRVTQYTAGAVVLFVGVLGLVYVLKLADVRSAEQARDDARVEVALLQDELAELDEYRILAEQLETHNALLASSMEKEISFSRVLNDLSLAFPSNASLQTLTMEAADAEGAQAGQPPEDGAVNFGEAVAKAIFTGYSVEGVAPGVETVLLDFERTRAFFNTFLTTAAQDELGSTEVTNFNGSVTLDRDAYTGRYRDGLPPEAAP